MSEKETTPAMEGTRRSLRFSGREEFMKRKMAKLAEEKKIGVTDEGYRRDSAFAKSGLMRSARARKR